MLELCWFERAALNELLAEAKRFRIRETGGALLGWRDDESVVVTRILGPGPNARHGLSYFEPDHEWQGREGQRIYRESGRTVAYVGDWHTHPRGTTRPSSQDRKTMAKIADDPDFRSPHPLSMIVSRPSKPRCNFQIYVWNDKALEPVGVEVFDSNALRTNITTSIAAKP